MSDPVMMFLDKLTATFGHLNFKPEADGQLHRFHVPGDRSDTRNGAYALYLDGIASGWYGTWKDCKWHTWSSRQPADRLEALLISQRIEQARNQHEAEQHQRQQDAAEYAARLWRDARRADTAHPYLSRKGCQPHTLRQHGDVLLVPLTRDGQLVNLQRIEPDGDKRFLFGGMVTGVCSVLGIITSGKPLYLCEGWATGATIHERTRAAVACAMNAGNLLAAGKRLQHQNPDAVLIVAGDDDRMTLGNPGRTYATKAAVQLSCGLVFPDWPAHAPLTLTDFNDLRRWREANQ